LFFLFYLHDERHVSESLGKVRQPEIIKQERVEMGRVDVDAGDGFASFFRALTAALPANTFTM